MHLAFSVLLLGCARARNVKAEPSLSQEYLDNPVSIAENWIFYRYFINRKISTVTHVLPIGQEEFVMLWTNMSGVKTQIINGSWGKR